MRKGNKGRAARGANRSVDVASGRGGGGQQGWSSRASCSSWRGRSVHLPVSIIEKVRRVRSMAGELKALRAESGANAADPVLKQAAPATTAESTAARCAQEREQAKWASVQAQAGRWQSQQRQDGGSVLARVAGGSVLACRWKRVGTSCGAHGLASTAATATATRKWVC